MNSNFVDSEKALLRRARHLDKRALAEVYDLFSPRLYRYSLRLLGNPGVAEECVADTFERFLLAVQGGGGPREYLQAYLYRIAHNWVTDYYRRNPFPDISLDPNLQVNPDLDKTLIETMQTESLRNALARLTADQRQVIALKYIEGWANEQISLAISKSTGAVKALQHRGLLNLQKMLIKDQAALK